MKFVSRYKLQRTYDPGRTNCERPTMEIVSENTPEQIAARRKQQDIEDAQAKVSWALRSLAANIMRVTRGAGRSYELGPQASEFVNALIDHHNIAGRFLEWELDQALSFQREEEWMKTLSPDNLDELDAENEILCGALQVVASRLVRQRSIESAGDKEMHKGMRRIEDIREERRKEMSADLRGGRRKKPKRRIAL